MATGGTGHRRLNSLSRLGVAASSRTAGTVSDRRSRPVAAVGFSTEGFHDFGPAPGQGFFFFKGAKHLETQWDPRNSAPMKSLVRESLGLEIGRSPSGRTALPPQRAPPGPCGRSQRVKKGCAAGFRTEILHVYGFDSVRILFQGGEVFKVRSLPPGNLTHRIFI